MPTVQCSIPEWMPPLHVRFFIRSALVEGDWRTQHKFYKRNLRALAEVEEL